MKIIFMGSPLFAAQHLKYLVEQKIIISAVFTQAPKPKNRGLKFTYSDVHVEALKHNIPVYYPKTLKNDSTIDLINSIDADIIVVVAYGFIIPEKLLSLKTFGCINVHPSKLPKYRGAAPLRHTLLNGETETAVCVIQMDKGIDTGDILIEESFTISNNITFIELHDRCIGVGSKLLLKALNNYKQLTVVKQIGQGTSYAKKFSKNDGLINWYENAEVIERKIRAMNPWPGTYFKYKNKILKILKAEYSEENLNLLPGTILDNFSISCAKGHILPKIVQLEGKKLMNINEFINGYT